MIKSLEYRNIKNKYVTLTQFKEKHITKSFVNSLNDKEINKWMGISNTKQTIQTAKKYYLDRVSNNDYYYVCGI